MPERGYWHYLYIVVSSWLWVASPASAHDYRAARDFSYLNPAGVWTFGAVQSAKFTPLPEFHTGLPDAFDVFTNTAGSQPSIGQENTGKTHPDPVVSGVILVNNVLAMHPSDVADAAVEFKVPQDDTYHVTGFFESHDSRPAGGDVLVYIRYKPLGAKPQILVRKIQYLPASSDGRRPGRPYTFDFTQPMRTGDLLWFCVNAHGSYFNDTTGFNVIITPSSP